MHLIYRHRYFSAFPFVIDLDDVIAWRQDERSIVIAGFQFDDVDGGSHVLLPCLVGGKEEGIIDVSPILVQVVNVRRINCMKSGW